MACDSFVPPSYCVAEVTNDARFTGGRLAHTNRSELLAWLAEFGIEPATPRCVRWQGPRVAGGAGRGG
jgi:hypothetical protein